MKDILVHGGNLKTGTTAIQAVLHKLRPDLALRGIVIPSLKVKERAHYRLALALRPDAAAADPTVAEMLAELRMLEQSRTPLLTAETFMGTNPQKMRKLLDNLPDRRPRLLFYVRPHAGMLASMYLQLIKNGKFSHAVDDICVNMLRLPGMRFMDVVPAYADVFGEEALTVREFSRERLVQGSIIADFWDALDLPQDLLPQALAAEKIANPTPTVEMSALLRAWREYLVQELGMSAQPGMQGKTVLCFFKAMCSADLPGGKFHLPVAVQQQLAERWEGPRRDFAARWFRLPPTESWLSEKIVTPLPPQPLPFDGVEAMARIAARNLRQDQRPRDATAVADFVATLPVETAGGARMVDMALLQARLEAQSAPARSSPRKLAMAGILATGPDSGNKLIVR